MRRNIMNSRKASSDRIIQNKIELRRKIICFRKVNIQVFVRKYNPGTGVQGNIKVSQKSRYNQLCLAKIKALLHSGEKN